MQGDGVYKSTDAGATWEHMGLAAIRAVARIRVHPENPDLVYVAALGDPTGLTTRAAFFEAETAAAIGEDSLREFADGRGRSVCSIHRARTFSTPRCGRSTGTLTSSGAGGRSQDCSSRPTAAIIGPRSRRSRDFPKALLGKIGITVAAKGARLYAVIEAEDGGLYRSDDRGESWAHVNNSRDLWQRSFYFNRIAADPKDPDTVYVLNFILFKSDDAGESFEQVRTPHADHHDLWIDPNDPARMICANDGGGTVSTNGGVSWTPQNYPTAQMYHVNTTAEFPYHVVGAQQDNSTAAVPSYVDGWWTTPRGRPVMITTRWAAARTPTSRRIPAIPTSFSRRDEHAHALRSRNGRRKRRATLSAALHGRVVTRHPGALDWVYPIVITRRQPHTLYTGSQHVWRSLDEGSSWEKISPDLTRAEPETLGPSGGSIVLDQDGPEVYANRLCHRPFGARHASRLGRLRRRTRAFDKRRRGRVAQRYAARHGSRYKGQPHRRVPSRPGSGLYRRQAEPDGRPCALHLENRRYGETWTSITSGIAAEDSSTRFEKIPNGAAFSMPGPSTAFTSLSTTANVGSRYR